MVELPTPRKYRRPQIIGAHLRTKANLPPVSVSQQRSRRPADVNRFVLGTFPHSSDLRWPAASGDVEMRIWCGR